MRLLGWTSKFVVVAAAVVAVPACGDVKASPDAPDTQGDAADGDFTLSVDPTSLSIPIAGSATATVTIARTGSVGDVMLSASGLGANLEAEFSPNPIPAGSTTTTATIRVKGGTAPATSTVMLTGTAGDKSHSASIDVTSTTITVTGTIRGNRAGVRVGIIGKQSVLSGAGGVFSFTDVTPPYDLYTFANQGCSNTVTPTVYYFDDLTRADPTVTAAVTAPTCSAIPSLCGILVPCPASPVSGNKSGAGNSTDPVVFAWTGPNGSFNNGALNSNGAISGTISWRNSSSTNQGELFGIQFTRKASGAPNTFLGHAKSTTTTVTDDQAALINLAFNTVNSTGTITGTVTNPAGYPAPGVKLVQEFGSTFASLWTADTTAIDATIPLVPTLGGTALYAATSLDGGSSEFIQPLTGTATVSFTMPAAAVPSTPTDEATGVTTATVFAWTAPNNVVSEANITTTSTQGTAKATYRVFTANTQITIPVIPELPLPAAQSFNWRVHGYAPTTSVNDAAAANELETVTQGDFQGPAHAYTSSLLQQFTTP